MGLLSTLSGIASGVSSVGSIASGIKGVSNLLGFGGDDLKKQYKYQKKLLEYQNQINRENATVDYERQRQMTADAPLLDKIGMKQAAINTSQGSTSAHASSAPQISSPSVPSPLPTQASIDAQYAQMANNVNQGLNAELVQAQIDNLVQKTRSEKTAADRAQYDFDNWKENQIKYINIDLLNKALISRYNAEVSSAESRNKISYQEWLSENDGQRLKQDFENKLNLLSTQLEQTRFDYNKAKEFKPVEFEKLKQEVNSLIRNNELIHEKTEQQKIINRFNSMGIGISNDLLGTAIAALGSGNAGKLADSLTNGISDFFSSLIDTVIDKIRPSWTK